MLYLTGQTSKTIQSTMCISNKTRTSGPYRPWHRRTMLRLESTRRDAESRRYTQPIQRIYPKCRSYRWVLFWGGCKDASSVEKDGDGEVRSPTSGCIGEEQAPPAAIPFPRLAHRSGAECYWTLATLRTHSKTAPHIQHRLVVHEPSNVPRHSRSLTRPLFELVILCPRPGCETSCPTTRPSGPNPQPTPC
jgi:hypothetical protein